MKLQLRDILKGHRAIQRIPLPLVNRPSPLAAPVPELDAQRAADGEPNQVDVGIRVLTGLEWATVYEKAGEFARARKVPDDQLNDRNPIYNLGCSVYTCVLACVDPDSDVRDPDPIFGERSDLESAALELLSSPHIGIDGINYLVAAQQLWQDRCSPTALRVEPTKMFANLAALCSEDDEVSSRAFLDMRPGMQWVSMRSMATQLRALPMLSSLYTLSSPEGKSEVPS